jgi:hypothetical protein
VDVVAINQDAGAKQCALGLIAITHHCKPAVGFTPPRLLLEKHLQFLLDRPANQLVCAAAQQFNERINNFVFLPKPNYRILIHGGVTPMQFAENDLDNRIPAGHAAFFNSFPYTRLGYTSPRRDWLLIGDRLSAMPRQL